MKLEKYLKGENVFIRDSFENTDSFYSEFAMFLKEKGHIVDNEKVKRLFFKRENVQSTAIGRGIAAPHIFCNEFSEFMITIALIKNGMDYKAPDNKKVHLVFLIMSDDRDVGLHLKTLAHIARLEKGTALVDSIKDLNSEKEIVDTLINLEKKI